MSFHRPELVWLILALPSLLLVGFVVERARRRRLELFQGSEGLVSLPWIVQGSPLGERAERRGFRALIMAGIFVALGAAGPQVGSKPSGSLEGVSEVVLLVDLSRSMTVPDVAPNRLEVARRVGSRIAMELSGIPVGLVVFAEEAFPLLPPTSDHGLLALYLQMLNPGMVWRQGSVPSVAIREALRITGVERTPSDAGGRAGEGEKAAVLLSDGETHEDQAHLSRMAREAADRGMTVHVVAVGTSEGGLIPAWDESDPPRSSAQPAFLKEIAGIGGGSFAVAGDQDALLSLLADLGGGSNPVAKTDGGSPSRPADLSFLCAGLAIFSLLLDRRPSSGGDVRRSMEGRG